MSDAQHRKNRPMFRGLLAYFPDALAEVANVSRVGNEQHNQGEPLHWKFDKSTDHADCLVRHLSDAGTTDTDGVSHTAKVAWRALALLQTELEASDAELHAKRQAQRDKAAGSDTPLESTDPQEGETTDDVKVAIRWLMRGWQVADDDADVWHVSPETGEIDAIDAPWDPEAFRASGPWKLHKKYDA